MTSMLSLLLVLLSRALPDDVLVRRYIDGNARALELLYERHRGPVLSFLTRLMGDAAEAEDAYVETWACVARALPRYEAQGKFKSFLFTVARREALHILERRANRDSRQALGGEALDTERVRASGDDPEARTDRRELGRRLEEALGGLTEELRTCFLLYHDQGLTVPEVAEATGLSPATVKRRIGKARTLLAARLAPALGNAHALA